MENFYKRITELIKNKESQPRTLSAMSSVLQKPNDKEDRIIYDVYRGVENVKNLRYDLTFIYPETLGKEFSKTYGHYHKKGGIEIMGVVKGKIQWLFQKYENNPKIITEVYLVEANEKESTIFLPGFGIISINPTKKETILSNWLSLDLESDYQSYTELHGACYYALENGEFIKNPNYDEVPELIKLKPREIPELGITFNKPIYDLKDTPEKLDFLNNPEKYKNILTLENCFTKI
ncbi:glucose-6-phosphate isomerase family protein [Patescibacteria group bacterium]